MNELKVDVIAQIKGRKVCAAGAKSSGPESRRQPEPSSDTAAAAVRPSTPSPHLLTETFSDPPSLQNTVTSETGAAM